MANLNGFDADQHEPMGNFEAIPKGDYEAIATESVMKDTKAGDGEYLQFTWEIVTGKYIGRMLWSRYNLVNPNEKAVKIGQRQLADVMRACGKPRVQDSSDLHGVPVILSVTVEEYQGKLKNDVARCSAIGNAPAAKPEETKKAPWA